MNRLTYNYKFHVKEVVDGRTISGLLDWGFSNYSSRRFQLSGMEFPDPKRIKDSKKKEKAAEMLEKAAPALESLLLYRDHEKQLPHGRTIILSPHAPNKWGRCLVNAYVPCENENFDHPHLTRRVAGYVLMNVTHYMQHLGERGFNLDVGAEILDVCNPYDFNK